MNSKTLHILNGDATLNVFNQANITGETLVWREILSEGPISKINLWETREKWICEAFGENPEGYKKKVIAEVEKLNNISGYTEIILWFEYDLVCQVNLIFILSALNGINIPINLICPNQINGLPNFRGLGELLPTQLQELLGTSVNLQQQDFDLASRAWNLYCANDPIKIEGLLSDNFGNLSLLKKALQAHLLRFPKSNGLNYIDEVLLAFINEGIISKPEIYNAFWAKESIFGMTDLQLDLVLTKLQEKGFINKALF